jgi:YgiT-type zinc finger domain-containing protein
MAIFEEIQEAVADAAYRVSGHAAEQMVAADLDEIWVLEATITGEVIERLPARSAPVLPGAGQDGDRQEDPRALGARSKDQVRRLADGLSGGAGVMSTRLAEPDDDAMGASGPSGCVRCGGELDRSRQVDRLVREGNDVAVVAVRADACPLCGEILLNPGMTGLLGRAQSGRGAQAGHQGRLRSPAARRVERENAQRPGAS